MFLRDCKGLFLVCQQFNIKRQFHTSLICNGKRNFRKFPIPNKRGIFEHPKLPKELLKNEYNYPVFFDDIRIRYPGIWLCKRFIYVREMEPDIIVPDFKNCSLRPYVSYRTEEIWQSEFTANDLFDATYGKAICEKYKNKESIPESWLIPNEKDAIEAKNKALKTGSDLFSHTSFFGSLK